MTHSHVADTSVAMFGNVHALRAHLVVAHSWPRWATVTEEGDDLRIMHGDMHSLEETLDAKDERRGIDIEQLRLGIMACWVRGEFASKLDGVDLKEAASLAAEYLLYGARGWNVERIHRV